jgi:spectinomycin phosphotransferase
VFVWCESVDSVRRLYLREKPPIDEARIVDALHSVYGLDVARLEFLPLGYDSFAAVYRVAAADGQVYFAKLRMNPIFEPSVVVPRFLKSAGNAQVVAPLPTLDGTRWGMVNNTSLLLYPFVEGEQGARVHWSESLWAAYGVTMRHIHDTYLPAVVQAILPCEDFVPNRQWGAVVKQLTAEIGRTEYDDPLARELAAFWRAHQLEIDAIVARAEELGRRLHAAPPEYVLCHADFHKANLLVTSSDRIFVVDWDQPMLAPKERDLMFVLSGLTDGAPPNAHDETLFFQGYGACQVNRLALAFYCYDWAMQDTGAFAHSVFLAPGAGPVRRREGVEGVKGVFVPGAIADVARGLDVVLD